MAAGILYAIMRGHGFTARPLPASEMHQLRRKCVFSSVFGIFSLDDSTSLLASACIFVCGRAKDGEEAERPSHLSLTPESRPMATPSVGGQVVTTQLIGPRIVRDRD